MNSDINLPKLSAQVIALRQAMEAVINGTTPDHAKWTGVNSFLRKYCGLATEYQQLTGDGSILVYDLEKLKNPFDMVWPDQKSLFDSVYTDTLMLEGILTVTEGFSQNSFFNLLVSGDSNAWDGNPFEIEMARCLREYTEPRLTQKFGRFSASGISELKRFPSILAFESSCDLPPKFGFLRDIKARQDKVRIEYDLMPINPFLTAKSLEEMSFELDIGKLELNRTHWALKEVNLLKELHAKGIILPSNARDVVNAVDISTHIFDVALSFPGEARSLVEKIVNELERNLGPNRYFYDNNYISQLAQPSLDTLLQGIYMRAKLDIVFIGADYQKKNWCGVEFRAIKEIIFKRENSRVMFIKIDDVPVDGVFATDGYVDARNYSPGKIAQFISERLAVIK